MRLDSQIREIDLADVPNILSESITPTIDL